MFSWKPTNIWHLLYVGGVLNDIVIVVVVIERPHFTRIAFFALNSVFSFPKRVDSIGI